MLSKSTNPRCSFMGYSYPIDVVVVAVAVVVVKQVADCAAVER